MFKKIMGINVRVLLKVREKSIFVVDTHKVLSRSFSCVEIHVPS